MRVGVVYPQNELRGDPAGVRAVSPAGGALGPRGRGAIPASRRADAGRSNRPDAPASRPHDHVGVGQGRDRAREPDLGADRRVDWIKSESGEDRTTHCAISCGVSVRKIHFENGVIIK